MLDRIVANICENQQFALLPGSLSAVNFHCIFIANSIQ